MTVCIVDDNALVNAQIRRLLAQAGLTDSLAFTDPWQALRWCMATPPDLVLLDYNMPDLDGLAFLSELQRHQSTRDVPVAMVSGWAVESMRIKALKAGAIDVIGKQFVPEEMTLKVFNLLRLTSSKRHQLCRDEALTEALAQTEGELCEPDGAVIELMDRLLAIRSDRSRHSMLRTGLYAAAIAAHAGLNETQQTLIARAAPFLDLGAWSVPSTVHARQVPVTASGLAALQRQPVLTSQLFSGHQSLVMRAATQISLSCREHWDGSGLPYGLAGEAIPLTGRIVAVANMFEQMTANQSGGRPGLRAESAASVIHADEGCQFDPAIVRCFDQALPTIKTLMQRHPESAEPPDGLISGAD
jgi:putative two-component system response regulator